MTWVMIALLTGHAALTLLIVREVDLSHLIMHARMHDGLSMMQLVRRRHGRRFR